jgi:hypothetical protein
MGYNFTSSILYLLISHITAINFNISIFVLSSDFFIHQHLIVNHERMDMYVQSGHLKYVRK